eukprot:TRINITY_DN29111_c0_g1_i1.p1 TRINITY_DN29111_c0_g1~~TRINITY_DN29111_c0_g1_i1.p1  ORF type:complete len:506 (-),score=117.08 TRINITY_DN29111_c0_g1_i1:298-1815(-)
MLRSLVGSEMCIRDRLRRDEMEKFRAKAEQERREKERLLEEKSQKVEDLEKRIAAGVDQEEVAALLKEKQAIEQEKADAMQSHAELEIKLNNTTREQTDAFEALKACWDPKQKPKVPAVTTRRIGMLSPKLEDHIRDTMKDMAEEDCKEFVRVFKQQKEATTRVLAGPKQITGEVMMNRLRQMNPMIKILSETERHGIKVFEIESTDIRYYYYNGPGWGEIAPNNTDGEVDLQRLNSPMFLEGMHAVKNGRPEGWQYIATIKISLLDVMLQNSHWTPSHRTVDFSWVKRDDCRKALRNIANEDIVEAVACKQMFEKLLRIQWPEEPHSWPVYSLRPDGQPSPDKLKDFPSPFGASLSDWQELETDIEGLELKYQKSFKPVVEALQDKSLQRDVMNPKDRFLIQFEEVFGSVAKTELAHLKLDLLKHNSSGEYMEEIAWDFDKNCKLELKTAVTQLVSVAKSQTQELEQLKAELKQSKEQLEASQSETKQLQAKLNAQCSAPMAID